MKVLVIGGGGREHALVWKIAQSQLVDKIFCLPGNAGVFQEKKFQALKNVPDNILEPSEYKNLWELCTWNYIDLIVVGPEKPLADGIVDFFKFSEYNVPIFGPTQKAAQLESSKWFAKELMLSNNVPTAAGRLFEKTQMQEALAYIKQHTAPLVVKADGLAAGKGAIVCKTIKQAQNAVKRCFESREFGEAGDRIIIEDYLVGHPGVPRAELSILALVDLWGNFVMFPAAQDYKQICKNDKGDNTGGMGAFAPIPWLTTEMVDEISKTIFRPVINEMINRTTPFYSVLYAGLMYTQEGFKVVEFNVRFGDPELQPLMMLMDFDLVEVMDNIAQGGSIKDLKLKWKNGSAVCVVMTSDGYPGKYQKGTQIFGLKAIETDRNNKIFHAGTKLLNDDRIVTNGGRVLNCTAYHPKNLSGATEAAYSLVEKIKWADINCRGPYFRPDIANDVPDKISY